MTLNQLKAMLSKKPTMMDLSEEKDFIYDLMQVDDREIIAHQNIFSELMNDRLVSRSVSFYEIRDQDKSFFMDFSNWLNNVANLASGPRKEEIKDLARIYSEFPELG
jgi:hypothetical protein